MAALTRRGLLELIGIGGTTLMASSLRANASEGPSAEDRAPGADGDPIQTRLTREYGLRHPFVGAGMAFVATPELVAAVSNAGGLGMLGNGPTPPPLIAASIRAVRAFTSRPFGIDFLNAVTALGPFVTADHVAVAAAERVPVVTFFLAPPERAWVDTLHAAGSKVWMQVGSASEALGAVAVGVDALVCQGTEAGGHNKSVQQRAEVLRDVRAAVGPQLLLLAAGGIADGRGVARALSQGAEGVWVGTRLVASREANAAAEYKRRLIQATDGDTVIQTIFGPEWPGQPQRVLRNRVVAEWAGRESQIPSPPPPPAQIGTTSLFGQPYAMPKFSAIPPTPDTVGDFEEMDMPAGEGVGLINEIKPAGDIVREMMREAAQLLRGQR